MTDIKSVIKLLCHILHNFTKVSVRAEHFRLGKFNIPDKNCAEIFWQIIHKLVCMKALDEPETCERDTVDCAVLNLSDLHYTHVYRLSADSCNRELLLALSWLLANDVLVKHMNYHIYKSPPIYCEFIQPPKDEDVLKDNHIKRPKFKNYEDEINYILLVSGKIKQNLKSISSFCMDKANICSTIHRDTAGTNGLSHLSVSEVNLVKNPDLLNTVVNEMQDFQQLMVSYLKWCRRSHVFWDWMLSVLKEKEKCDEISPSLTVGCEKLNEYLIRMKEDLKKKVLSESKENMKTSEEKVFNTSRRLIFDNKHSSIRSVIKSTNSNIDRLKSLHMSKQEELDKCLLLLRDEMPKNTLILQRKVNNST